MADIPLDEAELIAIFLETFLYGIFSTLFGITLWVLLKRRLEAKLNHILIAALSFMLVLSTAHITIDFIRIIEAFIFFHDPASGGPSAYYSRLSHPLHVTKNLVYTTMSLTGNVVMVWRCYVVYRGNLLSMIIPTVLLIASAVCGYAVCVVFSSAPIGSTIFATATPWITSFFVLTLCTNTYCTGSIVYRIWKSMRSIGPRQSGNRGLISVAAVLVESGGLHATAWLTLLITYLSDSNGQYVVLDTITPIVGIVFCLIIIRVDAFASAPGIAGSTLNTGLASVQQASYTYPNGYPMHPIDITVTTHQAIYVDETRSAELSINDDLCLRRPKKDEQVFDRDIIAGHM